MVSLTPGILEKLLQNAGDREFNVAGEHRSALLQVISIVPCLEDDPWKSRGYYLRVSDSLHSAYVSVSDEDVELILSDMVQLGQFIYITRLDSGSPVPVLRGIKPIPKRRPCVGDPKDLISSDFLNAKRVAAKPKPRGKVKKAVGNEEGRISFGGGLEMRRRLSLDSARRGWDSTPQTASKSKSRDSPDCVVAKKSSFSPLKSKNITVSPAKPVKKKSLKPSNDDSLPLDFNKVALSPRNQSERSISWEALPSTICDLGKDVRSFKKSAFASAVCALEEASLSECLIQCMSMFAELRELSEKDASGSLVEQFLSIHASIKKASEVITTLMNNRSSDGNDSGCQVSDCFTPVSKNASLWVQAAINTDLSRFSLYRKGGENGVTNGDNCHYVVIESHPERSDTNNCSTKISSKPIPRAKKETSNIGKRVSSPKPEARSPESGLKQAAKLAEKLLSYSSSWFLDYLEVSLHRGFGLRRGEASRMRVLLGQLKRVNQWLDGSFEGDDERIEKLRKQLYRFLLDNVDSAVSNK